MLNFFHNMHLSWTFEDPWFAWISKRLKVDFYFYFPLTFLKYSHYEFLNNKYWHCCLNNHWENTSQQRSCNDTVMFESVMYKYLGKVIWKKKSVSTFIYSSHVEKEHVIILEIENSFIRKRLYLNILHLKIMFSKSEVIWN